MKKHLIFLIILISFIPFITNKNDYKDITRVNYISSIGIDYDEENKLYTIYSYILNNANIASNTSSPGDSETSSYIIKTSSNNLSSAFNEVYKQSNIVLYYTHLETIIISTNFINSNNLTLFYNYIKDNIEIYPTFYLFITDSQIDEIFSIEYFSDISSYHTILINPTLIDDFPLVSFIDFAKFYCINNYTILIPHLSIIKDAFYKQDKPSNLLKIDGVTTITDDSICKTFLTDNNTLLKWLKHLHNQYFILNDYTLYIKEGKYKLTKKNDKIIIKYNISSLLTKNLNNEKYVDIEEKLKAVIKDEIKKLLYDMYHQNIDIYNIKYLFNIDNFNLDDIDIEIKFNVN